MKQLYAGKLYWPDTLVEKLEFPSLAQNERTEALVIGGGMSGMICAYWLSKQGIDTVLVERGEIGGGSTAANTGLIQFGNDILMTELADQIGPYDAERFYKQCKQAVDELADIACGLPVDACLKRRSSLYYASTEQHWPKLEAEFLALRQAGFDVELWPSENIAKVFGFSKPGAFMAHGDAEVNPLRFVHGLAKAASEEARLRLFERTDIVKHEIDADGIHRLTAAGGHCVEANHVVYAVGYEPEELKIKLLKADLNRSYVIVTGVQDRTDSWYNNCLIWESARPYLYLRTTEDGRIIIGGMDEAKGEPLRSRRGLHRHSEKLAEQLLRLFPQANASIEYEWNGTFGESRDNLPFIGEDPNRRNVYYCLGYGGNGTVYSMLGAKIIAQMIRSRQKDETIVHPLPFCDIR